MNEASLFFQFAPLLKAGVALAIVLHALAFLPQWRARYYHPDFLNLSVTGLVLAVAHGAVIALAGNAAPLADVDGHGSVAAWCLAGAVLVNLLLAVQNLLAAIALTRLHRPSALVASALRPAVQPLALASGALAAAGYAAITGWL